MYGNVVEFAQRRLYFS